MVISHHIQDFEGLPILEWCPGTQLPSGGSHAVRLSLSYEQQEEGQHFLDLFAEFVAQAEIGTVRNLVIGDWGVQDNDSGIVVEAIASARELLPHLEALFLAEMTSEECEVSWIRQSDVSPLFGAFANLRTLRLRGGDGLRLGRPRHCGLRKLVIETGGMSSNTFNDVISAELPALEHLELWLGDDGYGNSISADDIRQLLIKGPCANLKYLGLRDDCHADETVRVLSEQGLPSNVKTLDLSLGSLSDEGAARLVDCDFLSNLDLLDVHFHYVSTTMIDQLRTKVQNLNAADAQEADDWNGVPHRYVAVSE